MRMTMEQKDEGFDSKKDTLVNPLIDSCTWENEKNSCQDTKVTHPAEAKNGKGAWGSRRECLAAALVVVVLAGVGAGVGIASAPHILHQLGFTSKGLARASYASRLMGSTSRANNHTVPRDSWVSWLQRAGQKGLSSEHHAYFGSGGAIAGVRVVVGAVLVLTCVLVLYGVRRRRQQSS